jgi:hypothetical protein
MLKVTVIYPQPDPNVEISATVSWPDLHGPADDDVAMNAAFRLLNIVDGDEANAIVGMRSASCGDIFICDRYLTPTPPRYYICDSVGWKKVTKEQAEKWGKKSTQETILKATLGIKDEDL